MSSEQPQAENIIRVEAKDNIFILSSQGIGDLWQHRRTGSTTSSPRAPMGRPAGQSPAGGEDDHESAAETRRSRLRLLA
jgi:hypothetical protein